MDEKEIKQEFKKLWGEIKQIEKNIESKQKITKYEAAEQNYSGLAGGIKFLIDEKYFDTPKSVEEIWNELKKQVYHYPKSSISKLLSVNFTKNKRILNRIKENKKWKYVIRK